jgi:thioredoxin 1
MFSCHPFVQVNKENFNNVVLKSDKIVVIEFMAEWCGACHIMAPVMNEVSKQYGKSIQIFKIDVDKEKELSTKYNVQKVPTIVIFKDGEVVDFSEGIISKKVMLNKIKILLRNESVLR